MTGQNVDVLKKEKKNVSERETDRERRRECRLKTTEMLSVNYHLESLL